MSDYHVQGAIDSGEVPPKLGEVGTIEVHPDYRHKGIATALFDHARQVNPDVHHSQNLSPAGRAWVNYEQSRQASRTAGTPADLEWRHNLDGTGPEWELIATPPTGRTQVVQTENSGHQHYGATSIGDMPSWLTDAASEIGHIEDSPSLPGMEGLPASPQIVTDEDAPRRFDPRLSQPYLPGMEVVESSEDTLRALQGRPPQESAAPYGDRLEKALYDEFMDWWPNSSAYLTRTDDDGNPDKLITTHWRNHPDQPITHWLNVEDFLRERHPDAATGSYYGIEDADGAMSRLDRRKDPEPPTEQELKDMGYTSLGNVKTQAMLNLHNKLQGRNWANDQDRDRYMRLMLKHLGPQKAARLARLAMAITAAGSFTCPPGQPGCVSAMGTPDPDNTKMGPKGERPTAKDYAEPWDANPTAPDYTDYSVYSGVGGGGTGGGGSWGGGSGGAGGAPDANNIVPSSRALYDQLMSQYPGADIGGYRVDSYGEHARGALDFMTSDPAQAAQVRQKAFDAGAPYVLWQQQQWNADGTTSPMENRGDPTQNHYDHVHIAPIGG